MTARNSRGQQILQGRRAKGTFTPSPGTLSAQYAAGLIWPIFRSASGFVRQFWKSLGSGQTGASQFYAYAYDNAFTPDGLGGGTFHPEAVVMSKGTMTPTVPMTIVADQSLGTIIVTWNPVAVDSSQSLTDIPWYVVRNANNGQVRSGAIAVVRSAGNSGSLVMPPGFMTAGEQVDFYLTFVSDIPTLTAENVSTSGNASQTVVA